MVDMLLVPALRYSSFFPVRWAMEVLGVLGISAIFGTVYRA